MGAGRRALRLIVTASGAVAAAVALLPATIALLIVLLDLSAQALLGLSGGLLELARPLFPVPGGGTLAAYQRVAVDMPGIAAASLARALPPIVMAALAQRGSPPGPLAACVFAVIATVSDGVWGAAASLPGLAASLALLAARRVPPGRPEARRARQIT